MPLPNIFAIGDSHCIFYYDSHKIKNHWVGWGGMPVTMYTFIQSGIPLYTIVERMPPGDICPINVQENDIVLFCYGWNDVQKNIHTYSNGDYKSTIDDLVHQYITTIKHYSDGTLFKIRPIVNCVYPLPLSTNDAMTGSEQERITYTRYMNERLRAECLDHTIPFFDIYDVISTDDKLDIQYIDKDMTHLNRKLPELREIIEPKLLKICEDICKE
jgi:hypothetical protein